MDDLEHSEYLRPSLEIRAVHNLISRYWNVVAPPNSMMSGVNMSIILFLYEHRDEDVFQYDIEQELSITRSTVSRVISLMEKKGYVERSSVLWDARVRKITLTGKASAIAEEVRNTADRLERTLFDGFTRDEQLWMMRAFERMQRNLLSTGLVGTGKELEDSLREPPDGSQACDSEERTASNADEITTDTTNTSNRRNEKGDALR